MSKKPSIIESYLSKSPPDTVKKRPPGTVKKRPPRPARPQNSRKLWPAMATIAASSLLVVVVAIYLSSITDIPVNESESRINSEGIASVIPAPQTDIPVNEPESRINSEGIASVIPAPQTGIPVNESESRINSEGIASVVSATQREENSLPEEATTQTTPHEHPKDDTTSSAETTSDPQITYLLARADVQIEAKQLTTPVGNNARETYQQVLQMSPQNEEAKKGLERIKAQYKNWAEFAIQEADWRRAKLFLERGLSVDPEDIVLREALRDINKTIRLVEAEESTEAEESEEAEESTDIDTEQVFTTAIHIERVFHELLEDKTPGSVSISAQIYGSATHNWQPPTKVDVYVAAGQKFTPYEMYDDGSHGDRTPNDGEYTRVLVLKDFSRSTRYYIAASTQDGATLYSPKRPSQKTYVIKPVVKNQ